MSSPFEAQALIRGDSIVSSGHLDGWPVFLLQQPVIDHGAADQSAPTRANVWNGGQSRYFSGEHV
jgi:hypothetical protein